MDTVKDFVQDRRLPKPLAAQVMAHFKQA